MSVKRFGTIDAFVSMESLEERRGMPSRSEEFFRALVRYGSFDAYDVFCPDAKAHNALTAKLPEWFEDEQTRNRIEVSLRVAMLEAVTSRDYHAMHTLDVRQGMPALMRLRNQHARRAFPITSSCDSANFMQAPADLAAVALSGVASFDALVAPSVAVERSMVSRLQQMGATVGRELDRDLRVHTQPVGIESSLFAAPDKAAGRALYHIPEDWIVGLGVGRISPSGKTDWSPVLEMLRRVYMSDAPSNLFFILAGSGTEEDHETTRQVIAELQLQNRVLLFPNFQPDVYEAMLAAADFVIAPADNVAADDGLSALQAMARGLPVIAADFGPYSEIIEDGVNGRLIPTYGPQEVPAFLDSVAPLLEPELARQYFAQLTVLDVNALQEAILEVAKSESLRDTMGRAARSKARRHAWPEVIAGWEKLWQSLSDESRGRGKPLSPATTSAVSTDIARTYSHYPKLAFDPNAPIRLNARLERESLMTRYADVRVCLFDALEHLIIEMAAGKPVTLEGMRKEICPKLDVDPGHVDFHVMWLLKHGRLELC